MFAQIYVVFVAFNPGLRVAQTYKDIEEFVLAVSLLRDVIGFPFGLIPGLHLAQRPYRISSKIIFDPK